LLLEGFMYRFHAQWDWLINRFASVAEEPAILRANFGFLLDGSRSARDIRLVRNLGGGSFFDIGCYLVSAAGLLFGEAASADMAQLRYGGEEVDRLSVGMLTFAGGHLAVFDCDFIFSHVDDRIELRCQLGTIILDHAFFRTPSPAIIRILRPGLGEERVEVRSADPYVAMLEAFNNCAPDGAESEFARGQASDLVRNAQNLTSLLAGVRVCSR
jgi:D-xylose 1-dehydrogenase (NADP+, D-xylono-1,5-lactone-forming)